MRFDNNRVGGDKPPPLSLGKCEKFLSPNVVLIVFNHERVKAARVNEDASHPRLVA